MTTLTETNSSDLGQEFYDSLPTLAESMVKTLSFFSIERMYGIGGDFAVNLIKAFEADFQLLPSSNEMHAAFSACGQAEIEGMGCCIMTYTVGSLPCASAIALAKSENLPVIFISGAPGESEIGRTAIHHTVTSFSSWNVEYDACLNSFKELGIRSERLQGERSKGQPDLAGEHFFKLVSHAFTHNEPVFIEIPRDIVFKKTQAIVLPIDKNQLNTDLTSFASGDFIVKNILAKLKVSKKPLIYFGAALKLNKKLIDLILQFCEKNNIPFVSSWFAKGILDDYHPLSLGAYNGVFSDLHHRKYIDKEADYVIEVATSIFQMDANMAFDTGTHKLSTFPTKTLLKGTSKLQKDLLEIFEKLLKSEIQPFEFEFNTQESPQLLAHDKVDFHNLTNVLNSIQDKTDQSCIYLPEVGNSYFASYSLKIKKSEIGRGWICNAWYGAMGTSLPYARALCEVLKVKKSNDAAVIITGDGGFHFQLNELIHFMKDELNITIIYMRNNIFHLGKNSDAEIYNCSSKDFDVQKLISCYGGEAKICSTVQDFTTYFSFCMKENKGIKLIEVPVLPEPQYQCNEIKLLNTYISSKNGVTAAEKAWKEIIKSY